MSIASEMISHREGRTSYKGRVESFKHKMKTWEPGMLICSKYFKVNGVKLRIALYPNGIDQEAVNHVSLAICNASGVAIDMLMGDKTKYDDCHIHFPAGSFGGRDQFYNRKTDQDDDDADFEIIITLIIKKLWKQVKEDGVISNRSHISQIVVQRQESLGETVENLVDKVGEGANPAEKFADQDGIGVIDRANA